jgi:putative FmdB family regulatory protein
MPVYDYTCDDCGFTKEYLLKSSESLDPPCPECSTDEARRPMRRHATASAGIVMKNSWLTKQEQKWGRQGDPYRDEEGNKRPGVDDSLPVVPGPRTKQRWKETDRALAEAVDKGK